jgi:hypothetical protein
MDTMRDYVTYRRLELQFEANELMTASASMLGGGQMIARGERLRVIEVLLGEWEKLADWREAGEPEFVPPLSEADKTHWRWVKDRGLDIPAHIEAQL